MKKLFALLFALMLSLALVACGGSKNEKTDEKTESQTVIPTPESTDEGKKTPEETEVKTPEVQTPTVEPTEEPTKEPTKEPTEEPTVEPTPEVKYSSIKDVIASEINSKHTIKGVIVATQGSDTKAGSFVISDGTGSIFSYDKIDLNLGDEVILTCTRSDHSGFPQIASPKLVEKVGTKDVTKVDELVSIDASEIKKDLQTEGLDLISKYTNKYLEITGYIIRDGDYAALAEAKDATSKVCSIYSKDKLDSLIGKKVSIKAYVRGIKAGQKLDILVQSFEELEEVLPPFEPQMEVVTINNKEYNCITLESAIELAKRLGEGEQSEKYFIHAFIKSVTQPKYGNMILTDGTNELATFGFYNADGTIAFENMEIKPLKGDEVIIETTLGSFKGKAEAKKPWMKELVQHDPVIDETYQAKTILAAREAQADEHVIIEGVVAGFTQANGGYNNGFFLVDETGSIYVYGVDLCIEVSLGDKVKIAGTKTYYVYYKEVQSAQKHGYKGACQVVDGMLIETLAQNKDYPLDSIQPTTMKDLLNTPFDANITNQIVETTAYITKAPDAGFTNYYINDLDMKTGTYAYTQDNGNDYGWLDQYDGKLVRLHLVVINAKSTSSGCVWRVVPIKILESDLQFDQKEAANFVANYYFDDLINESYTNDPAIVVPQEIIVEHLGITAKITYASNNETSFKFSLEESNMVLHALALGQAEITITVTVNDLVATKKVTTELKEAPKFDTITVQEAIEVADNTVVTLKGIAGPSPANQAFTFYLVDETGFIAVRFDDAIAKEANIKFGNEIVIKGTKGHRGVKNGAVGNICVQDCELLVNNEGTHEYAKNSVIKGETLEAVLSNLDKSQELSSKVYELEVTLKFGGYGGSQLFVTQLNENGEELANAQCYSNGSQYDWAKPFENQKVTILFTLVNWNGKGYRACVLEATDGKTILTNQFAYEYILSK